MPPRRRILFLDDRYERIEKAILKYGIEGLTVVTNAKACLRELSFHDYDLVSLDFDLGGNDFVDPEGRDNGMEIIRYIEKTGWALGRKRPNFVVHSSNFFAANLMVERLKELDFKTSHKPFGWSEYQNGAVAGAFDVIHVGYVRLFADAKSYCHHLTVLLHDKDGCVFNVATRKEILLGMKDVDEVIIYETEEELTKHLESGMFDMRMVGSDHEGKSTRDNLKLKTLYHERNHPWSTSSFKQVVAGSV